MMEEIAGIIDRLIVMSELSSQILQEIFSTAGRSDNASRRSRLAIPDPNFFKDRFGVEGKAVLHLRIAFFTE